MPGAEMQDRLGLIEMKLDAIMAYLGIKNPYPAGSAPQGSPQSAASGSTPHEPFFVFRNDAYENLPQGVVMGSQSFSDDAHFTPRSQASGACHKTAPQVKMVHDGATHSQRQHSYERLQLVTSMPSSHEDDRHILVDSTSIDYPPSPGSMVSTAASCRTTESKCADPSKFNKLSVTIYSQEAKAPHEVQFSADAGYGEHGNKQGIGNSRSGQKMGQVKVSPSQGGNNGELSWRDIVPNIGITDHEAALLRPGNSTTAPVRETRVTPLVKRGSAPPKNRPASVQQQQRSASTRTAGTPSRGPVVQPTQSRRELVRVDSARERVPVQQAAPGGKKDTCSNVEVVKLIQQKIMELRHKESLDKKPLETMAHSRPSQVDRTALKYYNRVNSTQGRWHS